MPRARVLGLLATAAIVAGGCDGAARVCLNVRVDPPAEIALTAGDTVRAFWFDRDDDQIFAEPIEAHVRRVGDVRTHGELYGPSQRRWITAPVVAPGIARITLPTFYNGALAFGLSGEWVEKHPGGLWLEVRFASADAAAQAFAVRDEDGAPVVHRLEFLDGLWRLGQPVGTVDVSGEEAGCSAVWRVDLPLANEKSESPDPRR